MATTSSSTGGGGNNANKASGGGMTGPHAIGWENINSTKFFFWITVFDFVLDGSFNYPLHLINTRLQVQSPGSTGLLPHYSGTYDALRTIVKQEGIRALWNGFLTSTAGHVPTQLVFYSSYEINKQKFKQLQERLMERWPSLYPHAHLLEAGATFAAGGIAEMIAGFIWVPLDVVAQRLQLQGASSKPRLYSGGLDAFTKIIQSEGVRGLYYGYTASMLTYVPAAAVSWTTYETVKRELYKYHVDKLPGLLFRSFSPSTKTFAAHSSSSSSSSSSSAPQQENSFVSFIAGLVAGTFSCIVSNPLDVAKTRLQVDTFLQQHQLMSMGDKLSKPPPPLHPMTDHLPPLPNLTPFPSSASYPYSKSLSPRRKYHGLISALRTMVREEGLTVLSRGLVSKILFYAPSSGLAYGVYEMAKNLSLKD